VDAPRGRPEGDGGVPAGGLALPGWLDALAPELEAAVGTVAREHPAPAVVAGVVADGGLAWSFAVGEADPATGRIADDRTPFRVASVTKTFTATAVAQLHESGALSIDEPAVRYLPELAAAIDPFGSVEAITIRALLTHRSGLTSEPPLQDWRAGVFPSIGQTLAAADRIEVVEPPGSVRKYSNLGFQLLGEVVARVSETPYRAFVTERVLGPLGMDGSGFDEPPGAAVGHDRRPFSGAPEPSAGRRKPTDAEGGLWSTVADLARWLAFQIDGDDRVLGRETLEQVHRPAALLDEAWTAAQALGWLTVRRDDRVFATHGGGTPGFTARVACSRSDRLGVAVLANGPSAVTPLAFALADRVVDARRATLGPQGPGDLPPPEHVRAYLGAYAWPGSETSLLVAWREGALRLVWADAAEPDPALEPAGERDAFRIRGGRGSGERCRFRRDAAGAVVGADVAGYPLDRVDPGRRSRS